MAYLSLLLQEHFRLGIFSSATERTVRVAVAKVEEAAGGTLFDPALLLHRGHTKEVSTAHIEGGGNTWDTVKPLAKWFKRVHRVLLCDDDDYKVSCLATVCPRRHQYTRCSSMTTTTG